MKAGATREGWALRAAKGFGWRLDRKPPSLPAAVLSTRSSAIDALRAGAMIGVVVLHAAMAYIRVPLPHLPWLVSEPAPTLGFDLLCWWLLGVSMPIFFALGGFSAEAIFAKRGVRGFVIDRAARLGAPFIAALVVVAIPTLVVWTYGWYLSGRCSPEGFLSLDPAEPELSENSFGPAHLWFLEYILLYLVLFVVIRRWRPARPCKTPGGLLTLLTPILFAVPTTLLLVATHHFQRLDAVMNMHNSFFPDPWRLAHHGLFFLFGVHLYHHWPARALLARRWPFWMVSSGLAFIVRARFLRLDLVTPLGGLGLWGAEASAALFGWLSLFAMLGLALDRFDHARPVIKRWADSSYWIYLVHFPVVSLIQADLFGVALPTSLKFAIVVVGTLILGDASHAALVRPTVLGLWLGGNAGHRRRHSLAPHAVPGPPRPRRRSRMFRRKISDAV